MTWAVWLRTSSQVCGLTCWRNSSSERQQWCHSCQCMSRWGSGGTMKPLGASCRTLRHCCTTCQHAWAAALCCAWLSIRRRSQMTCCWQTWGTKCCCRMTCCVHCPLYIKEFYRAVREMLGISVKIRQMSGEKIFPCCFVSLSLTVCQFFYADCYWALLTYQGWQKSWCFK